jgi:RHS repeat-associated protein
MQDRLGTTGSIYPYGGGPMPLDGKNGFATYTRDASTGLDNAFHRNYHPAWGRFTTPDPYQASGGPADPQSWNRYAYVQGDPVNYNDPNGLLAAVPSGSWGLPGFSVSPDCGDFGLVSISPVQRLSRVVEAVEYGLVDWVRPDPEGRGYQIQVDAGTYDLFAERFSQANPIDVALQAPGPPLVRVLLVTGAVLYALADWWESRRARTTCTVTCQIVDFTLGIDMAIGYVQSTQTGVTYRDACTLAKLDIDRKINAQYGTQHRKRHCKEK